jgi:hypothetical protein
MLLDVVTDKINMVCRFLQNLPYGDCIFNQNLSCIYRTKMFQQ